IVVRFTGRVVLDSLIAIGVALIILKAAFDITRRSIQDLLDSSLPKEEQALIRDALEGHSEMMVGYHKLRSRKAGGERHVDLHLVVKPDTTVQESHDLCDHLEGHLETALGPASVNIHVEPCNRDCSGCHLECGERAGTG
ncbi:MAG: cation diffusion facilitator family transporter, partial [Chloroflexota bacterium]